MSELTAKLPITFFEPQSLFADKEFPQFLHFFGIGSSQNEKASSLREVLALINQFMFAFNYLAYSNQVVTV